MKIGIFYITKIMPKPVDLSVSKPEWVTRIPLPNSRSVWIRVVEVEAADEMTALDEANPRIGESVMNAHELP